MLHAVIMAGGSGTRLWPESRLSRPKQFLKFGEQTMLGATAARMASLVPLERVCVVAGRAMRDLVDESLPGLPPANLLAEPAARNTAPCIGLAAVKLLKEDPEATMVVLPADHVITPNEQFCETIRFAAALIDEVPERLVTLAIKPTFPSTSYGYIQRGSRLATPVAAAGGGLTEAYDVIRFHEKPPVETAKAFLADGNFGWNAGIFVWRARTILDLLERFEPEIGQRLRMISDYWTSPNHADVLETEFVAMKKISIDYAVMERAESIVVLDAPFQWDDVGTWRSLDRIYEERRDECGNLALGLKLLALDAANTIVRGDDPSHLVALVGVEDLIVVRTEQATLIASKEKEELVRDIIDKLKNEGMPEYL